MVKVMLIENCDIVDLWYKTEWIYVSTKVKRCWASLTDEARRKEKDCWLQDVDNFIYMHTGREPHADCDGEDYKT